MANWITLQQLSQKRGIDESTLRNWKNLGYVASSTVDDVEMLDEDSLTVYLNALQTEALDLDSLENAIKEKKQEYEILLSRLDDELFLMKTQGLHQKLYHIVMEELGHLILDKNLRDMFLAISAGEPIARVAKRHEKTYKETMDSYSDILNQLNENTERIATFRESGIKFFFGRFNSSDPTDVSLDNFLNLHAIFILRKYNISTVRQLMDFTLTHSWSSLNKLSGLGKVTYNEILLALRNAHYITIDESGHVEWSPIISAFIL